MRQQDILQQDQVSSILNRLKQIADAVMYAAEADTLGEVLERIAEVSRDIVGARYAALGVPDGRGGLQYFKFSGLPQDIVSVIGHLPEGKGLLGAIMKERQPIRLDHIADDPRSVGFPPGHPEMDRFVGVPIMTGDNLFGMLYLTDALDGEPFTEQDQWLVETIAGYAALAISGALLREQGEKLALLEERERISMELHDGVIQSLYAIGMQLELMRVTQSATPEALSAVMQNLNIVIEDIRRYIMNLKTHSARDKTAQQCLEEVVSRLHIPDDLHVEVKAAEEPMPFTEATSEAMCMMAHEALSNVIRHAGATRVTMTTHETPRTYTLEITDDGIGFDANQANSTGLGLRNIMRRARIHGGNVVIDSAPGRGTSIRISLPVNS